MLDFMSTTELIEEIKQISIQYNSEVGRGRKAWPKSIKERVAKLFEAGLRATAIAERTGLAYFTVLKWRPPGQKKALRRRSEPRFKELAIVETESAPIVSVTVPQIPAKPNASLDSEIAIVTVTNPEGFKIDVRGIALAAKLLRELMGK